MPGGGLDKPPWLSEGLALSPVRQDRSQGGVLSPKLLWLEPPATRDISPSDGASLTARPEPAANEI